MLKAAANGRSGRCALIGLTHEELAELKEGRAVHFDMRELGIEAELLLVSGAQPEDIIKMVSEAVPVAFVKNAEELEKELKKIESSPT